METGHTPAMDEGVQLPRPGNPGTAEVSQGRGEHSIPCMAPQGLTGSAEVICERGESSVPSLAPQSLSSPA